MPLDRRDFLAGVTAAAGMTLAQPARAAASDTADLRVAVIGIRGRGREHLKGFGKNVVAICDVDRKALDQCATNLAEQAGINVQKYVDYRRLLDEADIDGVAIATPNHTHVSISIAAMQAGKHVYVEKPVSHNMWESRQLVGAARKYDRLVQCGTQSRSSPSLKEAVAWVRSGELGAIQYAIGTCFKPRKSIGKLDSALKIPAHIDYDLWCGPAEKKDLYRPNLHYDWHWDYNTGAGDMGNQGIHQMDIARWFLGEDSVAPRVVSIGGRLGYNDAGDTANTQVVLHDYSTAPIVFETRGLPRSKAAQRTWGDSMERYRGSKVGVIIQCERGHVLAPSYTRAEAYDRDGNEIKRWVGGADHYANWLQAIAAGDRGVLNAEIREGHVSTALCHLGNLSHRAGEGMVADEIAERLAGRPLLSASFERMAAHLRANDVDVDSPESALTMGAWLDVDTQTERVTNSAAAESLWKREGRKPFAVPDMNV